MPAKPLLYLIDGSSQMYRAFHAPIRTTEGTLLRNAMGIPTNAVYIFVTMLRKLLKEHQPEFIAASFDLPGRTFRDDLAADYKANRKPMPDELAGADSARPSRLRGARRADHHAGALRSRRRDRDDDGAGGRRRATTSRSSPATRTSFSSCATASASSTRATTAPGTTRPGVKEKFGVAPGSGRRRAGADGRHDRQRQGRARHRREGRARSDLDLRHRSTRCSSTRPRCRRRSTARRCSRTPTRRASSRELLRIHTDVPVDFDIDAFRYRGPSREDCYELFSELGFRSLVDGVRADGRHDREGLPARDRPRTSSTRWSSELRAAGRFGAARARRRRRRRARRHRRPRVLDRRARSARYVPLRHAGHAQRARS